MNKQARKTKRLALFSENEKKYLKGKTTFDTVRKSQFHHNLDQRFDALLDDLELLRRSKNLKAWRSLRTGRYSPYFTDPNHFQSLFSDFDYGYPEALRRVSKGKGKHKKSLFWLDRSPVSDKIDERIFDSNYLFRHVKKWLTDIDKELFLKAYRNQDILPINKDKAISIEEIKNQLSGKSKIRTNVVQIPNPTVDDFDDSDEFEVYKLIQKHKKRHVKMLNKKLEKYEFKVMKYDVGYRRITESEKMRASFKG
jgi:hypothetical protein